MIRVLLVENHGAFRRGISALLRRAGLVVLAEVEDAAEALRLLPKLLPDVVVLDYSLPGMNGIDAARAIRRLDKGARLVLLTAHGEAPHRCQACRAGVCGYVLKSRSPEELVPAICRAASANDFARAAFGDKRV